MIALPLSVLALAAGVYLLIKVNREYLGGIFKFFAWLIILLSLVAVGSTVRHGIHHFRHRHECRMNGGAGHCEMGGPGMMNGMKSCGPGTEGSCPMSGCKMVGDSVILDKAMCEKMMGKEACDSICKLRGQCILTKDECAHMCGGAGKACSMEKEGGNEMKACCKEHEGGKEMKACCKEHELPKK